MEDDFMIVAITPPIPTAGLENRVQLMLDSGTVDRVHVRFPGNDVESFVRRLPARLLKRISVHAPCSVASSLGVQAHGSEPGSRSCSCHNVNEVLRSSERDYVFLSPVFDSISKPGYKAAIPLNSPEVAAALRSHRVVALGGATGENLPLIMRAGFAGAAFLGWLDTDDEAELERRLKVVEMVKENKCKTLCNFTLQFITDSNTLTDVIKQTRDALEGGCRWIQVRMKKASDEEVAQVLTQLAPLCRAVSATLIVDDRVELARICDGVHLGRKDMHPADARRILGPNKIIGFTVNNEADARSAAASDIDYVGMGPWRFTTTKKNLAAVLGADGFRLLVEKLRSYGSNVPIVGIGGVTPSDIRDILSAGASGIAVSGAIYHAADPVATTKSFIKSLEICNRKKTF